MMNNRPKGKKFKLNSIAQKTDPYGTTHLEAAVSGFKPMIVTEKTFVYEAAFTQSNADPDTPTA